MTVDKTIFIALLGLNFAMSVWAVFGHDGAPIMFVGCLGIGWCGYAVLKP